MVRKGTKALMELKSSLWVRAFLKGESRITAMEVDDNGSCNG